MLIRVDTGDTEMIRTINRFRILDCVRRFEPVSRQILCKKTGLSRSTVSLAVNALLYEGVLRDDVIYDGSSTGRGRPTSLLRFNPDAAYILSIKLSSDGVLVVASNLRAEIMGTLTLPIRPWRLGVEGLTHLLEDGVRDVIQKAGIPRDRVCGVVIGRPCATDATSGRDCRNPLAEGESAADLVAALEKHLGFEVIIESDVNLLALSERWFGLGRDIDDFAVVLVGAGVGMGLFLNGQLYRGSHKLGAGFGHIKVGADGVECACGGRGCVKSFASDKAIMTQARECVECNAADEAGLAKPIWMLAAEARKGNAALRAIFERAGDALGKGIANVVSLVDPTRIIITGTENRGFDLIEPALIQAVKQNCLPSAAEACEIVVHDQPEEAWVRGAAAIMLERLYRQPVLELKR